MSDTVNGNLSTEYVDLNPGVTDVEIAAMAEGLNANEIVYAEPEPEPAVEGGAGTPDSSWTNSAIQFWLTSKGIYYPVSATKAELLALVPTEA